MSFAYNAARRIEHVTGAPHVPREIIETLTSTDDVEVVEQCLIDLFAEFRIKQYDYSHDLVVAAGTAAESAIDEIAGDLVLHTRRAVNSAINQVTTEHTQQREH